jgi:uncharacterized protein (UPF0333 family)
VRGQITIEYLFLSLIALVLLSFSVISLVQIKDASVQAFEVTLFKSTVEELSKTMAQVCALGNGNARTIYLKSKMDVAGSITNDGREYAQFTNTNLSLSLSRETYCKIDDTDSAYGKIKVRNEKGTIMFD